MEQVQIRQWIEQMLPNIIEDLKRICRIRSVADVSEQPKVLPYGQGCVDVLFEMLAIGQENGFDTHNFDNYVGSITYSGDTSEQIGIWSHLDIVDEGEGWDYSPYEPQIKDGYFISRGCQDNKSSAIMGLYVLKFLKEHDIHLKHTIALYVGTCEEQGMYDLDYFIDNYPCPSLSLVPDSGFPVCCGERGAFNGKLRQKNKCSSDLIAVKADSGLYTVPDDAEVTLKYTEQRMNCCEEWPPNISVLKETIGDGEILKIRAKGVSTQAANPFKGKNALTLLSGFLCERGILSGLPEENAFRLINEINADQAGTALGVFCEDELSGPIVLVATQLRLEGEHLTIGFTSKYPITANEFPFVEKAERAAENYGFDLEVTRLAKANYFDPERQVVKLLTECSNHVLGREDKPFVMSGGTYAHKLPNAFAFGTGMPLPKAPEGLFRPGHGDYHQPDEGIALERICTALEIYILGMLSIDSVEDLRH